MSFVNRRKKHLGFSKPSALRPGTEVRYRLIPQISEHGSIYGEPAPITGNANRIVYYRSWTGVRTPGFGGLKKRQLPVNPHHVYTYTTSDGCYSESDRRKPGYGSDLSHTFGSGPMEGVWLGVPTPVHDLSNRNKAVSKLAERAGQDVNNLAQDLVQVNQLTRVVADTCKRLTGAIRAVKGRNIPLAVSILWQKEQPRFRPGTTYVPGPGGILKRQDPGRYTVMNSASKNWLELQYGWKPLLQDVYGAAKSLAYLNSGTFMVQTARSTTTKTTSEGGPLIVPGENKSSGNWMLITQTQIQFGMRYRIGEPLSAFLSQIGFNNPISLAWELIPYSFVVDWFLPIGEYLTGLKHWEGLSFVDGFETRFTRQTAHQNVDFYEEDATRVHWRTGNYSRDAILLDRLKLTEFPSMKLPSWKNPISTVHALNALALMRVAFSGQRFYGR